jgi:hypothetical protein
MADPNIIPFAEGAPADDLMVEELPDGDVLIGDPLSTLKMSCVMKTLAQTLPKKSTSRNCKKKPQS